MKKLFCSKGIISNREVTKKPHPEAHTGWVSNNRDNGKDPTLRSQIDHLATAKKGIMRWT